jgi:hypothetical protein
MSDITADTVSLSTDPILSDLRCELNPGNRCKSLGFRTSGPSPDPSL